jgi:hypothetical protein
MIEEIRVHGVDGGQVTFTDRDSQGFTATVSLSREELAKLVQAMDGGVIRSRFSSFMEPDTDMVSRAGAYLRREHGFQLGTVITMSDWERIWTAEALGWKRNG